jgi:hypothetical protein
MASPDSMAGRQETCPNCGNVTIAPVLGLPVKLAPPFPPSLPTTTPIIIMPPMQTQPVIAAPRTTRNMVYDGPVCQHCGGEMKKKTLSSGYCVGILLALIVFFSGIAVAVLFFWTIIGPIIGLLMVLMSLGMGGKRSRVWKCQSCGIIVPRA